MKTDSIFFHIQKPDSLPVGIKFQELKDIDNYEDNSIKSVILQDLLDYLDYNHIIPVLELFHKKLIEKGQIEIQGTDLKQLSSSIIFEEIDIEIAKKILYLNNKKSIQIMPNIITILENIGFEIIIKKYVNICEYFISAIKK